MLNKQCSLLSIFVLLNLYTVTCMQDVYLVISMSAVAQAE